MAPPETDARYWHCTACPGSKFHSRKKHQYQVHTKDGTTAKFTACSGGGCSWCQTRQGKWISDGLARAYPDGTPTGPRCTLTVP